MTSGRELFGPKLGLTLPLAGLHFLMYFLKEADPEKVKALFAFWPGAAAAQPWTFFTYQLLHWDPLNLFFGTLILYVLGSALEAEWGTKEFTLFWLVATLGASGSAYFLGEALLTGSVVVNVSMLFAYAYLFPETTFYIFFVIPVKVKWLAWLTAAYLIFSFGVSLPRIGLGPSIVKIAGMAAGFLWFWFRTRALQRARRAAVSVAQSVKSAGAVREDEKLEQKNRALFPKVEALRAARKAGAEPTAEQGAFDAELKKLVVPGVNICKPVDFKGDKDGICVRCEGFAECSLRYLGGHPEEIVVKRPSP